MLSVNLSTRDLLDQELPQKLATMLQRHRVPAERAICLEITESAIMDDPQRALATLERLSQAGFELSIDDFGTGYSSLAYLKRLPVDELKIDQSFVRSMETDRSDAMIVRSTIDLAHNLGLTVVAEGIEIGGGLGPAARPELRRGPGLSHGPADAGRRAGCVVRAVGGASACSCAIARVAPPLTRGAAADPGFRMSVLAWTPTTSPASLPSRCRAMAFGPSSARRSRASCKAPRPTATPTAPTSRDLRDRLWFSIDNADTLDLDQLSWAEALPDGAVRLAVAMADVDARVPPDSAIDAHAAANTTSVYTAAGVFPMLPPALSNDLTSLRESADRRAVVVEMRIDRDGAVARCRARPRDRAQPAPSSTTTACRPGSKAGARRRHGGRDECGAGRPAAPARPGCARPAPLAPSTRRAEHRDGRRRGRSSSTASWPTCAPTARTARRT